MFTVHVEYVTETGDPRETVACITHDIAKAYLVAKQVENYGYRFGPYLGRVRIYSLHEEIIYSEAQRRTERCVFTRTRYDGRWSDWWGDQQLEATALRRHG